MRKFGINRVTFRDHGIMEGKIPGITKASW